MLIGIITANCVLVTLNSEVSSPPPPLPFRHIQGFLFILLTASTDSFSFFLSFFFSGAVPVGRGIQNSDIYRAGCWASVLLRYKGKKQG